MFVGVGRELNIKSTAIDGLKDFSFTLPLFIPVEFVILSDEPTKKPSLWKYLLDI